MSERPIIVWFRRDLRLADNNALSKACETGAPILPVYVLDEETPGDWRMGGASLWWLHKSLDKLKSDLKNLGADLILRRGRWAQTIPDLAREVNARAVHFTRCYEPWSAELEKTIHEALASDEEQWIEVRRFTGVLLKEPGAVCTKDGTPYKVFTPFWRAMRQDGPPRPPVSRPDEIVGYKGKVESDKLSDWSLLPNKPDWAGGLRGAWSPGESGAHDRFEWFLDNVVADYHKLRDIPSEDGTSRLSPHLHFGEISPAYVWHKARARAEDGSIPDGKGLETFLQELVWREFSANLLYFFPHIPESPWREEFAKYPWDDDAEALKAWQKGKTGYPIVDAGMRQLWAIGWMHNRVRMIVGSFLVKDLLIHWREGEAWFWDTLVDADLASNASQWQWVAGSGADAAPYFRIFNPVTQGEKFDPEGEYVRKWVPELKDLPKKHIHAPWDAPEDVLEKAGVTLGKTYPKPIVDHKEARKRALEGYEKVKG